jgi:hypothetical protein
VAFFARSTRLDRVVAVFLATLIALPFTAPFSSCPLPTWIAAARASAVAHGTADCSAAATAATLTASVRDRQSPEGSVLTEEKNEKEDEGWKHLKTDAGVILSGQEIGLTVPTGFAMRLLVYTPVPAAAAPLALRL